MKQEDKANAIVLFDGVCNLCNTSINFIIDNDPRGYFKFASLQSPEGQAYLKQSSRGERAKVPEHDDDDLSSVILIEKGHFYYQSSAVLQIARKLRGGWPLLYFLAVVPAFIRDIAYRWVARNRYKWFGRRDTCRLPTPELRSRFLDNLSST